MRVYRSSLRRLLYSCLGLNLAVLVILLNPWSGILKGFLSPLFLFLLPGCCLFLIVSNGKADFIRYVLKSFIFSVAFNFIVGIIMGNLFSVIMRTPYILLIFSWNTCCLFLAFLHNKKRLGEIVKVKRSTVVCIALWAIIFLSVTAFALSNIHAPTPDEAFDIEQARFFYLDPGNFLKTQIEASPNKNPLVSFLFSRPLHVISVSLTMLVADIGSVAGYVAGAFEVSMLVFAVFSCAKNICGDTKIGLVSALFIGLNPVLFHVGVGILTDVSVLLYILVAYNFYLESFVGDDEEKVRNLNPKSIIISGFVFLCAFMVKIPTTIFFFTALLLQFLFLLFKNRESFPNGYRLSKILVAIVLVYLCIDFYYVLGTYYLPNLPGISFLRRFLFASFFETMYRLVNPFVYAAGTGVTTLLNVNPSYLTERLYLTILSPHYFTFGVYFLFFVGLLSSLAIKTRQVKNHVNLILLLFFTFPLLVSLIRPSYELSRSAVFIYPFIVIVAAYGLCNQIPRNRVKHFLVLSVAYVFFVFLSEYLFQVDFQMIPGGILGTSVSPPTLWLLLPSLLVVLWKGIPFLSIEVSDISLVFRSRWKSFQITIKKSQLMASLIILLLVFSSVYLTQYYMTTTYRHEVSPVYVMAANWLGSHVSSGDVVMSNTYFLDYFLNDTMFLKTDVRVLPENRSDFESLKENVTYLVLFTKQVKPLQWWADLPRGSLYAFEASMNPPAGMVTVYEYPENNPIVRISAHLKETPNRIVLADDQQTFFWIPYSAVENGGIVGSSILSADNSVKKSGNDSLRIEIPNGTFRYSGISHVYESMENWSKYDYLSFYWFGGNTGNTFYIEVRSPDSKNRFVTSIIDDFNGWKQLFLSLDDFSKIGNPSWTEVKELLMFTDGKSGTWHIDYLILDKIEW